MTFLLPPGIKGLTIEKLHIFISLLRSLQPDYDKNFLLPSLRRVQENFIFILLLRLLRQDQEKKRFFQFRLH